MSVTCSHGGHGGVCCENIPNSHFLQLKVVVEGGVTAFAVAGSARPVLLVHRVLSHCHSGGHNIPCKTLLFQFYFTQCLSSLVVFVTDFNLMTIMLLLFLCKELIIEYKS